jgi:putative transposase
MPRLARLDSPGVLHHIMIRGIERRNIFRIAKDRKDFLDRLSNLLPETQTSCYAWVLMSNHAHFLLRTGTVAIAKVIRCTDGP